MSDRRSFKKAVLPHMDHLHAVARSMIGDRSRTGELVLETLIKARDRYPTKSSRSDVRTWLTGIMESLWTEKFREPDDVLGRVERGAEIPPGSDDDTTEPGPDRIGPGVNREQVRTAFMNLPASFRRILLLASAEDAEVRSLAERLDLSTSTVRTRLARARQLLSSRMDNPDVQMEPFRRTPTDELDPSNEGE